MTDVNAENLAELRTELEVLSLFDVYRDEQGNDRGKGQRRRELERRRGELQPFDLSLRAPSFRELEETALRLRAERTKRGGDANAAAWRALRRDLAAAAHVDEVRQTIRIEEEVRRRGEIGE